MIVELLLVIVIAVIVAYVAYSWSISTSSYQGSKAIYDLSKGSQQVLPNANLPWSNRACALRFAIYVSQAPRTLAKVDCVVNSSKEFAPSCSDYTYKRCDCNGIQCGQGSTSSSSNCSLTETSHSYLSKLVSCGDALELWGSGYTSQTDKPYVPAILRLRTVQNISQHSIESISLPAIPLQVWTVITIVKEGRRIDVYYGTKAVASKILDYIPATSSGQSWIAGNPRWRGQIGFFSGFQQAWTARDVERDVSGLVDTRGVPRYINNTPFTEIAIPSINIPSCPFGDCNPLPTVNPANPYLMWESQNQ